MKNLILKNGRTYANRGMKEVREVNKKIQKEKKLWRNSK